MAEKSGSNGDYSGYSSDFKRSHASEPNQENMDVGNDDTNQVSQKTSEYISELLAEKLSIDEHKCPHAYRLIDQEIQKAQVGKLPSKDQKYVDIYRERPVKVAVKVLVPVREHPKFNFVGKLLGPKGNSMKRLQEETMCKMAVLGRGSMKDRQKEEELRQSLDPKYAHLTDDLHVEISALGPPAEAHARVAYALAEVRKYLIPDNNDNIRQEQMREMETMGSIDPSVEEGGRPMQRRPPLGMMRGGPRPHMPVRSTARVPASTPRVMPAKTKIMSILDRARIAMEESYTYDDGGYDQVEPAYESYMGGPGGRSTRANYSTHHYYEPDYEQDCYRDGTYEPSSHRWKTYKSVGATSSRHSGSARYRSSPYTHRSK